MVLAGSNWIGWIDFCCIIVAPPYGQIGISNGNQNEARYFFGKRGFKSETCAQLLVWGQVIRQFLQFDLSRWTIIG